MKGLPSVNKQNTSDRFADFTVFFRCSNLGSDLLAFPLLGRQKHKNGLVFFMFIPNTTDKTLLVP